MINLKSINLKKLVEPSFVLIGRRPQQATLVVDESIVERGEN